MSDISADTGGSESVENMDAGVPESGQPVDNTDRRLRDGGYDAEGDEPEQREPTPRGKPDAQKAAERIRRENRELKARLEALERDRDKPRETPKPKADPFEELASIDPDKDPIGAIQAQRRVIEQEAARRAQENQSRTEQETAQKRVQELAKWGGEAEAEFREDHPDYDKAAKHLAEDRIAELVEGGYSKAEANQALQEEFIKLMARCRQNGADPAEAVYKMAQKRGYKLDNGANTMQTKEQGRGATSPFAGTGARSGTGGVSVSSVANAPRENVKAIRAGNGAFDKDFAKLKAATKGR